MSTGCALATPSSGGADSSSLPVGFNTASLAMFARLVINAQRKRAAGRLLAAQPRPFGQAFGAVPALAAPRPLAEPGPDLVGLRVVPAKAVREAIVFLLVALLELLNE